MSNDGDGASVKCSCKIGRNSREYGIPELNSRLQNRHADGASLRDLEQFLNETLLQNALRETSVDVIGDESAIYQTLVADDVSAGRRTETRERLTSAGLDVPDLLEDFVSYQTVRTHLRTCLDVDTDRETLLSVSDGRGTIEWARSRSEAITARTLERLAESEHLPAGDLDVSSVIRVSCQTCGTTRLLETFFEEDGCECTADGPATERST